MKRFLLVLTVLLVLLCLLMPTVAMATTGEVPDVEAMALYMTPFAFLVPVVVSVVNRFKKRYPKATDLAKSLVGVAAALLGSLAFRYFWVMPEVLRVLIVGVVVWLAASGVFDLFKPRTSKAE